MGLAGDPSIWERAYLVKAAPTQQARRESLGQLSGILPALPDAGLDSQKGESAAIAKAFVAQKLALCHSELSEGLEGDRKGLMDDKLPHRKMIEVELADAVIRAADLAGALGLDLGGAIAEKLAFNANRPDHKPENRAAAGGKAY